MSSFWGAPGVDADILQTQHTISLTLFVPMRRSRGELDDGTSSVRFYVEVWSTDAVKLGLEV